MELKKVSAMTTKIPSLWTAERAAEKVNIPAQRLIELAESGHLPHWKVDDGQPMFEIRETKAWIDENLTKRFDGSRLPTTICVTRVEPVLNPHELPDPLKALTGLIEVTHVNGENSGIYFLCGGEDVVYVGQTKNVFARIRQHGDKAFSRALFMRWPAFDLDRIESSFIRVLMPKYNFPSKGDSIPPGWAIQANELAFEMGAISSKIAQDQHRDALGDN